MLTWSPPRHFDWWEYLDLAKKLAGWSGDEAALRSAVSRAYYAAYKSADEAFPGRLRTREQTSPHLDFWNSLKRGQTADEQSLGRFGLRLWGRRCMADYDNDVRVEWQKEAEMALGQAQEVKELLARTHSP